MLMAAGTNRGHLQRTRGGRAHGARALPAGGHAARARRRAQGGPGAGARRGECATTPTVYYRESRTISTLSLWSCGDWAQARHGLVPDNCSFYSMLSTIKREG